MPWIAVLVAAAVALGGVAIGDLTLVASVTDFAVYLVFLAVNAVVIVLRWRQPHRLRPFRIPFAVGRVPVPAVLAFVVVLVMIPGLDPAAIGLGMVLVLVGLAVHLALVRWGSAPMVPSLPPVGEDGVMRRTRVSEDDAAMAAEALGIDLSVVPWSLDELRRGLNSELGHGTVDPDTNVTDDDLVIMAKIALAHLNEIPDYYTRLAAMEAEAFTEQEAARRRRSD